VGWSTFFDTATQQQICTCEPIVYSGRTKMPLLLYNWLTNGSDYPKNDTVKLSQVGKIGLFVADTGIPNNTTGGTVWCNKIEILQDAHGDDSTIEFVFVVNPNTGSPISGGVNFPILREAILDASVAPSNNLSRSVISKVRNGTTRKYFLPNGRSLALRMQKGFVSYRVLER
jgi:hypothetical protein